MKYVSDYQINATIDEIANSALNGEFDTLKDVATLTYYGMKLQGGIDKLVKQMPVTPTVLQVDQKTHIEKLQSALSKISELIRNAEGSGSTYFSNLTEDADLSRHPYVKLLGDFRLRGLALPKAVSMISDAVGAPKLAISSFIESHRVKYPQVDDTSVAYIKGQDDARRLVGTNVNDIGTRMHEMQMKFLKGRENPSTIESNSYIAGFSSMLYPKFNSDFIKSETDKGNLLSK